MLIPHVILKGMEPQTDNRK